MILQTLKMICVQEKFRWGCRILKTNLCFFVKMAWKYRQRDDADTCNFLASTSHVHVSNYNIENSKSGKCLVVKFDNRLTFDENNSDLCIKTWLENLYIVQSITFYKHTKATYFYELFFKAQFNYCMLIWTCHSRENNGKINPLHKRWFTKNICDSSRYSYRYSYRYKRVKYIK